MRGCFFLVGLPGIEPGLHPPHGRVLPIYYSPHLLIETEIFTNEKRHQLGGAPV